MKEPIVSFFLVIQLQSDREFHISKQCLEQYLNSEIYDKNIETVNLGYSGYALYDEWLEYLRWGKTLQPDMVVITLSSNDVELYRIPGENQFYTFWNDDSVHLLYFKLMISDIHDYLKEHNIPLVIAYFSNIKMDIHLKAWNIIKELCEQYNINVVNISSTKDDECEGKTLVVSEVDSHLSGYSNHLAAVRLKDYLLNNGFITKTQSFLQSELYHNLILHTSESIKFGNRPEFVFYRLKQILQDKDNIIHDSNEDRFLSLNNEAGRFFTENIKLLFLEAYAEVLKMDSNTIFSHFESMIHTINRISKNLFVLRKNLADRTLSYTPYPNPKKKSMKIKDTISSKLSKYLEDLKIVGDMFCSPFDSNINEFSEHLADLAKRKKWAYSTIRKFLDDYVLNIRYILDLIECYDSLLKEYNPEAGQLDNIDKTFYGLLEEFLNIFGIIEYIIELCKIEKMISLNNFAVVKNPILDCTIDLKCNIPKCLIKVQLDSIIPFYSTICCSNYVFGDSNIHTYYFQFPIFALGKIRVILLGHGDFEFDAVKLYIKGDNQIILKKENFKETQKNVFDSNVIFTKF